MVPFMITAAVLISCITSIYGAVLAYIPVDRCNYTDLQTYSILNILFNGLTQPIGGVAGGNPNQARNQFLAIIITQVLVTAILSLIFLAGQVYVFFIYDSIKTTEDLYTVYFFFSITLSLYAMNNAKSFFFSILTSKVYRQTFIKAWQRLFIRLRRFIYHR
ncbi:hypothetical protein I4U23_024998 [Adineta vaga]|nr:hypothetical protein I4U23_024998 [Adineta vaga]